jgi:hypothetical protein
MFPGSYFPKAMFTGSYFAPVSGEDDSAYLHSPILLAPFAKCGVR